MLGHWPTAGGLGFKCTLSHNETSLVVLASLVDIFPHQKTSTGVRAIPCKGQPQFCPKPELECGWGTGGQARGETTGSILIPN